MNLAVHTGLAYAASNQLCVLRAEIKDQYLVRVDIEIFSYRHGSVSQDRRFANRPYIRLCVRAVREPPSGSSHPIVRCFLGDLHIMHMAFAVTGVGNAHERGLGAHVFNRRTAGVTHRCTQTARELMQNRDH